MFMHIVIVGGSFAGVTAAIRTRQNFKDAQITLLEKQAQIGFIPGALHAILNKQIKRLEEAYFISKEELQEYGITVILNAEVQSLDSNQQQVTYQQTNQSKKINYDKLIIATGSVQSSYRIKGIQSHKIITYKSVEETKTALALVAQNHRFTILGGGQVGVEMADSLIRNKKKVQLVESMNGILVKYFDQEMLQPLIKEMKSRGVHFYFNETVREIEEIDEGLLFKTQNSEITSDCAVFALSVKPQIAYLDDQIRLHEDGAIYVDRYLKTSVENIFAIGDAIQTPSSLSDESFYISLANNAVRTGIVVADNLLKPQTKFIGTARTIGTKVFGYYIASTGMTETESIFFDEKVASIHMTQPASLFNKQATISGKLIYSVETGQVRGAQLISQTNILEKINTLSLGIQMGITITELAQKDYFFHSAWSPVYDITNHLGLMKG